MKRILILVLMFLVGCPEHTLAPRPTVARSPVAMAKDMTLGAWLRPPVRECVLGASPTADQILNGALDQDYSLGWLNNGYPASGTHALRYVFGDKWTGVQAGVNDRLQIYSYYGIEIRGDRQSLSTPTPVGGGTDPSMIVVASSAGAIRIDSSGGTAGTAITASFAGTFTTSGTPATVPANNTTCSTAYGTVAVTGVAASKPCFVGAASVNALVPWCRTTAGTFNLCFTNPTAAALAPPASTAFIMRDIE